MFGDSMFDEEDRLRRAEEGTRTMTSSLPPTKKSRT